MSRSKSRPHGSTGPLLAVGAASLCAAFALYAASCNVYTPALLEGEARPPSGDGVGWWSKPAANGCFSAGVPRQNNRPRPTGGADLDPILLAIRSMRLGGVDKDGVKSATAWQDIGFDLDGVCTRSGTCAESAESCQKAGTGTPFDGTSCRDNTFGRLQVSVNSSEIAEKYRLSDEAFNCALCVGDYNFLIKVSGYNGAANDDTVRVDLYASPGLDPPLPWDCSNAAWHGNPCFTADQPFTVQDNAVTEKRGGPDLPDAVIYDDAAYVRDGYVVMTLPEDTLFWFPGKKALAQAFPLTIKGGIVTGRIGHAQDGTWVIDDGVIAGRALASDIVKGFRLIGFCETDPNYALMTEFLRLNVDIVSDGTVDPEVPCDGISIGVAYTAGQATAGKLVHVDPLVECSGSTAADAGADAPRDAPGGG